MRHISDWIADVCSSDLIVNTLPFLRTSHIRFGRPDPPALGCVDLKTGEWMPLFVIPSRQLSETQNAVHGQFNYRSARSLNGRICVRISVMKAKLPFLVAAGLAGVLALSGSYGYDDGCGYGGVSVGSGYYGSSYYDPYYGGNCGWYNGYYYTGSGSYVFERGGKPIGREHV